MGAVYQVGRRSRRIVIDLVPKLLYERSGDFNMNKPPYTITSDSISIIWNGKSHTIGKGATNFLNLRNAILNEDWEAVPQHLSVPSSLQKWANGKFTVQGNMVSYEGKPVPAEINHRITQMSAKGESPAGLFKFWEKLTLNPSYRSVNQLFQFLLNQGIPIDENGCILAYKSVRPDFKDFHSGQYDNKPGTTNEMPRNQISDDPQVACHEGFHVGNLSYAQTFGDENRRIVICKVDPENVVCVPYDASQQKMRVSKYEVIGIYGTKLPSTTFDTKADGVRTPKKGKKAKKGGKKAKKQTSRFDKLNLDGLMKQSIESLRNYATKHLSIVGASKIPGGKVSLIRRILNVR